MATPAIKRPVRGAGETAVFESQWSVNPAIVTSTTREKTGRTIDRDMQIKAEQFTMKPNLPSQLHNVGLISRRSNEVLAFHA